MKLIWNDYLIISGIALSMGSVACTNWILVSLPVAVETARHLEGNPIAQNLMFTEFWWIVSVMFALAALLTVYTVIRRQRNRRPHVFLFITFLVFTVGLRDFVNDFPILLKLLLGG